MCVAVGGDGVGALVVGEEEEDVGLGGLTAGGRPCFVEAPEDVVAAGATAASVAAWSESAATARPRIEWRKDFTGKEDAEAGLLASPGWVERVDGGGWRVPLDPRRALASEDEVGRSLRRR